MPCRNASLRQCIEISDASGPINECKSTPVIAALSAHHLAAILFPALLCRLYVAVDADAPGRRALERLFARGREAGIKVLALHPALGDFNDDLRCLGLAALQETLRAQLVDGDAQRFLPVPGRPD